MNKNKEVNDRLKNEKGKKTMTQRNFFESIMSGGTITDEMIEHATVELGKLVERAEKRKNYRTPAQKENDEIKDSILTCFVEGVPMTGKEVAEKVEISTQKANALLRQLVNENHLIVAQVENGKRLINSYSLA